jgi:hypothetical protein
MQALTREQLASPATVPPKGGIRENCLTFIIGAPRTLAKNNNVVYNFDVLMRSKYLT